MKEIDDSGSEFFPLLEPIQGGKQHSGLGGSLLAKALLSVAAAGLLTVSALAAAPEDGGPAVYVDGPPAIELPADPDPPQPPPEEPPEVKKPVKKPEVSEPPITPPPTTPPPTTPPPTTPPPTTPPPTTPPPTTPPPYYPPYNPPEPEPEPVDFTDPSLELYEARYSYYVDLTDPTPIITIFYDFYAYVGSATRVDIQPSLSVPTDASYKPDWAYAITADQEIQEEVISFPVPADFVLTKAPGTLTLTMRYQKNGADTTQTVSFPLAYDGP